MKKKPKNMKEELNLYKDEVYFLNKSGKLIKISIETLEDYNHLKYSLHHYIPYSVYIKNENWFKERGIEQKLILVSIQLHEHMHNLGNKLLSDAEFENRYKISRWELIFNRKYSKY